MRAPRACGLRGEAGARVGDAETQSGDGLKGGMDTRPSLVVVQMGGRGIIKIRRTARALASGTAAAATVSPETPTCWWPIAKV